MKRVIIVTVAVMATIFMVSTTATAAVHTGYLSVPPDAFVPKESSTTWFNNGASLYTAAASEVVFFAPVFLPHGAVIKNVLLEATDNSTDGFVRAHLAQTVSYNNMASVIADVQTSISGADGEQQIACGILDWTVDNQNHSYYIGLQIDNGTAGAYQCAFHKVMITYEYNSKNATVVIPIP